LKMSDEKKFSEMSDEELHLAFPRIGDSGNKSKTYRQPEEAFGEKPPADHSVMHSEESTTEQRTERLNQLYQMQAGTFNSENVALWGLAGLAAWALTIAGIYFSCRANEGELKIKPKTSISAPAEQLEEMLLEPAIPVYETNDFKLDNDEVLLARMIYGEARNCSDSEKAAVAYTAVNRANDGKKWNGTTLREAILKPKQYSCFNPEDPNRASLMDPMKHEPEAFERCLAVARGVLSGDIKDPVGATHYFNPDAANPSWAAKMQKLGKVGNSKHVFYRE
jgi:hypothetical protein